MSKVVLPMFRLLRNLVLACVVVFSVLASVATFSLSAASFLGDLMGAAGLATVSKTMSSNTKKLMASNAELKVRNIKLVQVNNEYRARLLRVRKMSADLAKRSVRFIAGKAVPIVGTGLVIAETGIVIDESCEIVEFTNDIAQPDDKYSQACARYVDEKNKLKTRWDRFSDKVEDGWKDFSDKAEAWYKSW